MIQSLIVILSKAWSICTNSQDTVSLVFFFSHWGGDRIVFGIFYGQSVADVLLLKAGFTTKGEWH